MAFSFVSKTRKKNYLRFFILVAVGLFGACRDGELETICAHRLPEFLSEVSDSRRTLTVVWNRHRVDRGIASSVGLREQERMIPNLALDQRDDWMLWARRTLHEVQEYSDVVDVDPALRRVKGELSRLANELVHFHGYSEKGNLPRMVTALATMQDRLEHIEENLCGFRVSQLEKIDY